MPMSRLLVGTLGDVLAVDQDAALVDGSRPDEARRAVVLPQPDGPSSATNSPGSIDEVDAVEGALTRRSP